MARIITIVGNGKIERCGNAAAQMIDASDLVIRFNDCGSVGSGGKKTDIVAVCNTGRPAREMMRGEAWKANPAVQQAAHIWCVRDPLKFADLREPLSVSHPELDDFCDDFTADYQSFCEQEAKGFHIVPASTHDSVDHQLRCIPSKPYIVPSSGLVVIYEWLTHHLHPADQVILVGFGHEGWHGHPFTAERVLVDRLVEAGRLSRIETVLDPQRIYEQRSDLLEAIRS